VARTTFPITGDETADALLARDPLALLIGMLLDQQVPMEWAFRGPATLAERLGGLDAARIAAMSPDSLEVVFREKPALHRYPSSMAKRTHALCVHVVEHYGGDAAKLWSGVEDPDELLARLRALPGYGDDKAKIMLAILAKRFGRAPLGWERVAAPFSDDHPRSAADVDSPDALLRVREWKRAQKAASRSPKSEHPKRVSARAPRTADRP
jgi:uncharacterized HhH-GPD family protein